MNNKIAPSKKAIMVSIKCFAYNHEKFIRETLEGFIMQKTNFRFEAVVHDDASTDNTADIIKEYAEKYPDIIKPIYETENLYSKKDGSLLKIVNEACKGKYIAFCEGDDYWIDPYKLQKQVDFLEAHPDYSMCWTDGYEEYNGNKTPFCRYSESRETPVEDIIEKGGDFIPTCSILVRKDISFATPKGFYCGDYPLQIWSAYKGKVHYLSDKTCVYRFMAPGSWTSKAARENKQETLKHFENEKYLLDSFDALANNKYKISFEKRKSEILYNLLLKAEAYDALKPYLKLRLKYGKPVSKAIICKVYKLDFILVFLPMYKYIKQKLFWFKK